MGNNRIHTPTALKLRKRSLNLLGKRLQWPQSWSRRSGEESVFVTVTTLRAGQPRKRGSCHGRRNRLLSSPKLPDRLCDLPSFPFNGYRERAFADVKRPGSATDDSPPSSVKVKNERSYTSTYTIPSWRLQGSVKLKQKWRMRVKVNDARRTLRNG